MDVPNIETAVRLYYSRTELGNKEIRELFSCGKNSAVTLKKRAKELMAKRAIKCWNAKNVDTETAYQAWGLDIQKLEERLKKITSLKAKGLIS